MMKRTILTGPVVACVTILFLLVSCGGTKHNELTPAEVADGWVLLFDGETMNGWKDYNGESLTAPWHVVDGCLQAKGGGSDSDGYIVTAGKYENFELSWDWKLAEGGNSGMMFHVVENKIYDVPYITGPEYQLLDPANTDLEPWQGVGADYAMYVPDRSAMKVNPVGKWNTSKIVFDNGHVEFWMNGAKIVEYEAWTDDWFARKNSGKWEDAPDYGLAKRGVFCLQDHGYPASFRNIKVKELPRRTKEIELFNGKDLAGWDIFGTELWYVADGVLYCESGPDKRYGYLATKEYYDDFDLTAEFRQESDGNSGLFFRSIIQERVRIGWQCEVAPKGRDTGGIYETGVLNRGWLQQIPDEKEEILKVGEWNTIRILARGGHITTWLNGTEMSNLEDKEIARGTGRIAIQIHDGGGIKVGWRNLILKAL